MDEIQALVAAGRIGDAAKRADGALKRALDYGSVWMQCEARLAASLVDVERRDLEAAAQHAQEAEVLARRHGLASMVPWAVLAAVRVDRNIGDYATALERLEPLGQIMAGPNADLLSFEYYNALANVHLGMRRVEIGRAHAEQALRLAQLLGAPRLLATAQGNLSGHLADLGEQQLEAGETAAGHEALTRAAQLAEQAIAAAFAANAPALNLSYMSNLGGILVVLGRDEQALSVYKRHRALTDATGDRSTLAHALYYQAKLRQRSGCTSEALGLVEEALECSAASRFATLIPYLHELASSMHESAGRFEPALAHFKRYHHALAQSNIAAADQRSRVLAVRLQTQRALNEADVERERSDALRHENGKLQRQTESLAREALQDPLTGLPNRRAIDLRLQTMLEAVSVSSPCCLALLDVDHFKHVNDRFSHAVGDRVLQAVADVLTQGLRGSGDFAGRFGGEEFVIALAQTDLEHASRTCDRLRNAFMAYPWERISPGLAVTVSLGVARLRPEAGVADALARADALLYLAKDLGRNRVCAEQAPPA